MSLLLVVLPAEGASISVSDADTCSSCRCCVQTNTNPAPTRNTPAPAAKTVRADREARTEPSIFTPPALATRGPVLPAPVSLEPPFPVSLFQRHCSLLI
jgi:hypothetical protein